MKKLLGLTWLLLTTLGTLGQGTVFFSTRITPLVDAKIYDLDGVTPLSGSAFLAQIYAGPSEAALTPAGAALPFRSDAGVGYVDSRSDSAGGVRIINGVRTLQTAYVQVRAWEAAKGTTFETARAAGGKYGISATITVVAGGDLVVPPNLIGLKSFSLQLSGPPTIAVQPQPVTTGLGGLARFEVTAGGPPPFTYQWRKNGNSIPGATSRVFEIPSVTAGDAASYSVRVTNPFNFIDSAPAKLVIAPLPVISQVQITPTPPLVGRPMRIDISIEGTGPITIQWRRNNADIFGANQAIFEDSSADPGTYSVKVTGPGGSVTREVVTVSPNYALFLVPLGGGSITPNPAGDFQTPGSVVTLRAVPDAGYTFSSWNGAVSGNANPTTLLMNDHKSVEAVFTPSGGTVYFVNRNLGLGLDARVFDTDGSTPLSGSGFVAQLYAGATIETLQPIGPTVPFLEDAGAGYFRGQDRSISLITPGQKAFVQIRAWDLAAGATYEAARQGGGKHGANLPVEVTTGNFGSPPSLPTVPIAWKSFKLQIGAGPVIIAQPKPQQIGVGGTARFEVQATGSEPLSYQWSKGTSPIPGATSRVLELRNITAADEGPYSVRITNSHDSTNSLPALLSVVTVYTLTLSESGPGDITATPESSGDFGPLVYLPNTVVTLQAVPSGGAVFVRWEGAVTGSVNPTTVTLSANRNVHAVFEGAGDGGTVDFRNFGGGIDAPVFDVDGVTRLSGPAFLAQLYAGATETTLVPTGPAVPFRTEAGAGYIDNRGGSLRVIPNVLPGGRAFIQIRAWDAAKGSSFEQASAAGGRNGTSAILSVIAGGGLSTPALPVGLASFRLRLSSPPVIRTQPASLVLGLGARAKFEVVADGSEPLSYQWRKGTSDIPGATGRVFEIPAVTEADAATYTVRVTNPLNSVVSDPATLALAAVPAVANVIVSPTPPLVGRSIRLEVVMAGAGPFTFQWRLNQSDISGATSAVLDRPAAVVGTYSVRIGGPGGSITRDIATVSAEFGLELAVIRGGTLSANPARSTYPAGTSVSITATADPGYAFSAWSGDASGNANPVTITMSAHRRVEALFIPLGGTVYFVNRNLGQGIDAPILDEGGTTRASGPGFVAQLYAGPTPTSLAPVGKPLPLLTDAGAGYFRGEDRSIPNVPPGGLAHVQIRAWELASGETYEAAAAAQGKHGASRTISVITGNVGSPPSLPAFLSGLTSFELRRGAAPRILTPPEAVTVIAGKPAVFSVVAEGSPEPAYQWLRNDTPIPGATLPTLSFPAALIGDAALYSVRVSNSVDRVTSAAVALTVLVPPAITALSPPTSVFVGDGTTLNVTATGSAPLAYFWFKGESGDTAAPLGVSAASFETGPLSVSSTFWVRVTNAAGFAESASIPVSVARRQQTIRFDALSSVPFSPTPIVLSATASSGLPVGFSLVSGPATLQGNQLITTGAGVIRIAATQPGNDRFLAAPTVEQVLTVDPAAQSIQFTVDSPQTFGDPAVPLVATATSGLPVSFELVSGPATLTAGNLLFTGAGTVVVRARQPGDANHLPAPPVERSISVQKASAVVRLSRLTQTFDGSPKRPDVSVSPNGLLVALKFDGSTTPPSAVGQYAVLATVDDPNYSGSDSATFTLVADVNLAGTVFDDADGSGTRDPGEPGIAAVTVRLLGLDGSTVVQSTQTDAEGAFAFRGVATGSYYVQETNPTGFISTTADLRLISLSPGTVTQIEFGDQAVSTIAGVVFEDVNGDGTRNDDESGIPGVSIRALGGDGQRTTTTDVDGSFQFVNLNPGQYTVEETDPANYFSTTPNVRNVSVAPGGAGSTSFGDQAAGSVTGIVFEDRNGNGAPDEGEGGIPNVTVRLSDATTLRSTRTDADGRFRFAAVPPGTYTVEEIDPIGFTSTTPNLRTISFGNAGSANAHFGDQPEGTVGGVVFQDLDGNGLQDASETGLPGVVIRLAGSNGQRNTSTGPDGSFLFANVLPGSYTLEETDPAGYTSTTPNVRAVNVAAGGAAIASFGDQILESISGVVFEDLNGNAAFDDGEPGIGGVHVLLVRTSDNANVGETTTTSNGAFLFANIPPGSYEVRQLLPSGYTVLARNTTPPAPSLHAPAPPNAVGKTVSFAEGGAASASFGINVVRTLSGMVFNDLDGNGLPSPGESGLGGVRIEVRNAETDALIASTSTAGDGLYLIPGLATGSYNVHHAAVPGFVSPQPTVRVSISASSAAAANFPVHATATASGRVFNDENGDGIRGPAEPGIGGARLTLHRVGDPSPIETETATDGTFLLTDLPDGEWKISLAPLPGFQNTTPATVTVTPAPNASITATFGAQSELLLSPGFTTQPADLTLVAGGSGALTAVVQGNAPLELQWLKNGTPIPGATSASLAFNKAQASDDATYQLRARNAYGTALSRSARVMVRATGDAFTAWADSQNLPADLRLPNQDADLDGVSNLIEFLLGTPPLTPTPDALPAPVIVTRNGAGFLGFELRTRVAANVRLFLESSPDLAQWTEVAARQESGGSDASGELIRIFDSEPLTAQPVRFVRLGVAIKATQTGPATLRVISGPPVANAFQISIEGTPGVTYAVQGSDDLLQWSLVQEIVAGPAPVTLTDTTLGGARYRFYRAIPR